MQAVVIDKGDSWLVTFRSKWEKDMAGGHPNIFVRKTDLTVVDRYYTQ